MSEITTNYSVYDVFSEVAFGGNPLAIINDAKALPEASLQKIAREFNFSETVFLYPPENAANTAKMRIFTPTMEIPFAGHPTIGTAVALAQGGHGPDMVLELGVGPLKARATVERAEFHTAVPLTVLDKPDPELVVAALGLELADIKTEHHVPLLASVGLPFTITELNRREALARCETNISAFRKGAAQYAGALDFAQFAYVREGMRVEARMFAPLDNMPEDPATGSACAALGALLVSELGEAQELQILQGEDMGRPSHIGLKADESGVTVSGAARKVMSGKLSF